MKTVSRVSKLGFHHESDEPSGFRCNDRGPGMKNEAHRHIAELHEYIRHGFNLFFGWFTFFATVNYASMGWLAKPETEGARNQPLVYLVCVLFIAQNTLGVVACAVMRKYLISTNERVLKLERIVHTVDGTLHLRPSFETSVPIKAYIHVTLLVAISLIVIMGAWCFVLRVA